MQDKHYGTEGLTRLIEYIQNDLKFDNIELEVFSNNLRGIHLYNKLGFKEYKREKIENKDIEDIYMRYENKLDKYLNQDSKVIKSLNKEGKIINIYSNNKVEVIFNSGVKKEIFEDGYQIVHFSNGDLKQIFPDGKMIYYFKDSKVTQTTYKNGLQIFKFSNGQVENHYADGSKQITFPDGTIKYIYQNGYEETWDNEKNIQQININLNNNKEVNKLINEEEG